MWGVSGETKVPASSVKVRERHHSFCCKAGLGQPYIHHFSAHPNQQAVLTLGLGAQGPWAAYPSNLAKVKHATDHTQCLDMFSLD